MTRPAYAEREIADALAERILQVHSGIYRDELDLIVDALAPVVHRAACAAVNAIWRAEHEMKQTPVWVEKGCLDAFVAALQAGQS